jgi:hypothetical protein
MNLSEGCQYLGHICQKVANICDIFVRMCHYTLIPFNIFAREFPIILKHFQEGCQQPFGNTHEEYKIQIQGAKESFKNSQRFFSYSCYTHSKSQSCDTHCKTVDAHVPLNFKSMESGPMTNVITPTSFKIRVLKSFHSCMNVHFMCFLCLTKSRFDTNNGSLLP